WRERIEAASQRALHICAAARLGDGRPLDAEAVARVAAERDPYDEEAARLLMAARDATGNRAGALHAYEALRRLLDEELGVRPSDETESRYRALLGAAPDALPRAERSRRPSPQPAEVHPFIGRV